MAEATKKTAQMSGFFSCFAKNLLGSLSSSIGSSSGDIGSSIGSSVGSSSDDIGSSISSSLNSSHGGVLDVGVVGIVGGSAFTASGKTKHANESEGKDNFLHFFDFLNGL